MKQVVSLRETQPEAFQFRLNLVASRHREFDERLRELGRRAYLTPTEQREILELKKRKLKAKDELDALRRGL
jgi:uncharacterized protein YdcH (DUF465 family)